MQVLDHICGLIDDTIRDLVVFSVCRASMVRFLPQNLFCCSPFIAVLILDMFMIQEGYVWVLLNGGPSRAFSTSDITIMEDDLNMLKVCVLFIVVKVNKPLLLGNLK